MNSAFPSHGSNLASNITVTGDDTDASAVIANHNSNPVNEAASSLASQVQATSSVPYGNGFHEVPAAYVKQIQSGEFFDNQPEEPIVLTLENSVIKAKKAS